MWSQYAVTFQYCKLDAVKPEILSPHEDRDGTAVVWFGVKERGKQEGIVLQPTKKHLSDDRENFICTTTLDKALTFPLSSFQQTSYFTHILMILRTLFCDLKENTLGDVKVGEYFFSGFAFIV